MKRRWVASMLVVVAVAILYGTVMLYRRKTFDPPIYLFILSNQAKGKIQIKITFPGKKDQKDLILKTEYPIKPGQALAPMGHEILNQFGKDLYLLTSRIELTIDGDRWEFILTKNAVVWIPGKTMPSKTTALVFCRKPFFKTNLAESDDLLSACSYPNANTPAKTRHTIETLIRLEKLLKSPITGPSPLPEFTTPYRRDKMIVLEAKGNNLHVGFGKLVEAKGNKAVFDFSFEKTLSGDFPVVIRRMQKAKPPTKVASAPLNRVVFIVTLQSSLRPV